MFGDTKLHIKINGQSGASMSPINTHKLTTAAAAVFSGCGTAGFKVSEAETRRSPPTRVVEKHDTSRTQSLLTSWSQPVVSSSSLSSSHGFCSDKASPFFYNSIAFVSNPHQLVPAPHWSDTMMFTLKYLNLRFTFYLCTVQSNGNIPDNIFFFFFLLLFSLA